MADIKPHLDPAARRGQPHSQFWYDLATTDPEGLRVMEDIVIAQHSKALTVLEGHEKHLNMEPPHPLVATVKGGVLGGLFGLTWGLCSLAWNPDMIYVTKKGPVLTLPTYSYLTRTAFLPSLYVATIGSTYLGVQALSYQIRGVNDCWNAVNGGFCAGVIMGSVTKRADQAFLTGLGIAFVGLIGDFYKRNSGSLFAWDKENAMQRRNGVRPYQHRESEELMALKEKYPQHRNL